MAEARPLLGDLVQRLAGTGIVAEVHGAPTTGPFSTVTHDSRSVVPGALHCCVVGEHHDGHDHADGAVASGATALVVSRRLGLDVAQVVVAEADARSAMAVVAAAVHGDPSRSLSVVGVTGTNGKTTVVSLLADVLRHAGRRVAVIGTLTGARTTPESAELQAQLAGLRDGGVTDVAMEVSSHALALHRVDEVHFSAAVFTNLGHDHLDFHRTQEAYFAAKASLFEPVRAALGIVNVDDVHGRLLLDSATIPMVACSLSDLDQLEVRGDGSSFRWRGLPVRLPLPGRHNVSNALEVAETAVALGVSAGDVAAALGTVGGVPGRFEHVRAGQDFTVVVDYAHTPDALRNVLAAARELTASTGGEVRVVFGCGGDRDAAKRPEMGRAATEGADHVIVTNDNPRSEDPLRIIEEIRTGCEREPLVEPDRRAAIRLALRAACEGDVVVIAGKGHEVGQYFADRTEDFDDRVVALEELEALDGAR